MKKKIYIEGMVCDHCKKSVEETLKKLSEITEVKVDLNRKMAEVELRTSMDDRKIKEAIEEIGYEVRKIEND